MLSSEPKGKADELLEVLVESNFVQEDIGIMEFLVEPVLHLLDAGEDTIDITVARCRPSTLGRHIGNAGIGNRILTEYNDGCVGPPGVA